MVICRLCWPRGGYKMASFAVILSWAWKCFVDCLVHTVPKLFTKMLICRLCWPRGGYKMATLRYSALDWSSLPVHSHERRPSANCPDVFEDLTVYRYDTVDKVTIILKIAILYLCYYSTVHGDVTYISCKRDETATDHLKKNKHCDQL